MPFHTVFLPCHTVRKFVRTLCDGFIVPYGDSEGQTLEGSLVAGGRYHLSDNEVKVVAGAHNHLRCLYFTPNIIKRKNTNKNNFLAA